jgi:hypothetical protein
MTIKDKALNLALAALEVEQLAVTLFNLVPKPHITTAITAIKKARSAPTAQELVSDTEIEAWAERHDIQGTLTDLRCMFEDAASFSAPPAAQPAPVQKTVAWGVFEGGNLHDMFFSKEEADNMAHLKGPHAEVRPLCTPPVAQRQWVGLIRGVRVEGDTVVITVKGGNDAARELCGALLEEKST